MPMQSLSSRSRRVTESLYGRCSKSLSRRKGASNVIPERQREALMRLTMCARDECMMCIYQPKDDRCKDIATTAMHILANALKVDDDTPQDERSE